jgi:tRNA-dihydrouridine synthase
MRPAPTIDARFAIALDHARMAAAYEPDRRGAAIEFRKHLGWYVKGLPASADLRKKLHAVNSLDEVEGIFDEYLRMRDTLVIEGSIDGDESDSVETAAA